jgi:hypothetical protein
VIGNRSGAASGAQARVAGCEPDAYLVIDGANGKDLDEGAYHEFHQVD